MVVRSDVEVGITHEKQPLLSSKSITAVGSSSGSGRKRVKIKRSTGKKEVYRGRLLFTIFCTLVVALGPISFGFSLGYSSPTQAAITKDLRLSVSQFSTYGSLVNLGAMIGALVSGRIADRFGRKKALVLASIPHVVGWLGNAFTQNLLLLYLGRLFVGFGVGVISFTVPMYIAEIAPKHMRGSLGTVNQLSVTIGVLLAYLGGLFLNWRILAFAGIFPCTILMLGLPFIPESPRWLAKAGAEDTLISSLKALRGKEYDISAELLDMKDAAEEAYKYELTVGIADLFKRSLFRPLLIGVGLQALQQLSGINAVMFYSSSIFRNAGFAASNLASFYISLLQVVITGVAAGLMDKAGRRLLLMVSALGMAVSCFIVGVSFYLKDHLDTSSHLSAFMSNLSLISLLVYVAAFSLGIGPIPWIIMSEVFPSHVKGMAGSLATLVNWSSSWLVTLTFNFLLEWSATGSFFIFGGECIVTLLFVAFLVPETRGRTLEEIEALLFH